MRFSACADVSRKPLCGLAVPRVRIPLSPLITLMLGSLHGRGLAHARRCACLSARPYLACARLLPPSPYADICPAVVRQDCAKAHSLASACVPQRLAHPETSTSYPITPAPRVIQFRSKHHGSAGRVKHPSPCCSAGRGSDLVAPSPFAVLISASLLESRTFRVPPLREGMSFVRTRRRATGSRGCRFRRLRKRLYGRRNDLYADARVVDER